MKSIALRFVLACGFVAGVSGCSFMPVAGPRDFAIESSAAGFVGSGQPAGFDYVVVDINENLIPFVSGDGTVLSKTFGVGKPKAPDIRVGLGDIVQVTIFESRSGGLFIPKDAGSRPGNFVQLPPETIDRLGQLSVPYAGEIHATGRRLPEIQRDIEARLENLAIQPKALVTLVSQRSTDVSVLGDVRAPARVSINPGGERILDAIARGGGLSRQGFESTVTLERGGKRASIPFDVLVNHPEENVYLVPGDAIYVTSAQRYFMAFGASGQNGQFPFDIQNISLGDAVGKAGGLLDDRANPGQVFVFRHEKSEALRRMNVDVSRFAAVQTIPVIYRVDMRQPSGFFAATKFPMRDRDILFVSNSHSVELVKVLNVINAAATSLGSVPYNIEVGRAAAQTLTR